MMLRGKVLSLLTAIVVLAVAACSSSHRQQSGASLVARTETGQRGTWVGTVDGTDALIAVVSDGVEVTVYACDDKVVSLWFRGLVNGGHPRLDDGRAAFISLALGKDK